MTPLEWFGVASLIISAIAGGVSAYSNYKSTTQTNAANIASAENLNKEAWGRDDTSFQRAVADAKAAGLSPLVAAENAGFNTAPIMSTANAPQMDLSGLMGALGSTANFLGRKGEADETKRHNIEQEKQGRQQLLAEMVKTNANLNMQNRILKAEQKRTLFESYNKSDTERAKMSHDTYEKMNSECCVKLPTEQYTDWNKYVKALAQASKDWKEITKIYGKNEENKYKSEGKGGQGGVNLNWKGAGVNINGGGNGSENWNEGWRWLQAIREAQKTKAINFKWPEYIGNPKDKY